MTSNNFYGEISINRPPPFNGEWYGYWKEKMKIFLQGIDLDIWDAVENGPFIPTRLVNNVVVNKPRNLWTKKEKEKVQYNLKAKTIISIALSMDEFYRVSNCSTAKEMWDTLQVTHEGTPEVKRARMNTLTRDYELFRMKSEENIKDMQTRFIHIVNHLRALGKTFNNEDLINKVLGCLNRSWQPKVTAISESRDLASMDLATLFGKLQEHEMQLNRLIENEEGEKKKKGHALAATTKNSDFEGGDSSDEDDVNMALMFQNFKKFMRHQAKPKQFRNSQKKSDEGTSFNPTCYKCGKKGHIKSECLLYQKKHEKLDRRPQIESKGRRAYISMDDNDTDSSDESDNEEANLCLMVNQEEEVNSFESEPNFTYDELLFICEELNKESSKFKKIVSTSKKTISTLESKIEVLNKEIDILKEKQVFVSNVSTYTPCENNKENIECNECNILKDKVEDLNNVLAKFTMGRDKLDIILGNQKASYNKVGLGYQPKRHTLPFKRNFSSNKTSSRPFVKCFYCNKNGHTSSICNLRKNQYLNNRWEGISNGALPKANSKGPKMIWVPKAKN
ncbi:unnamed protein product [Trifolium pratense]|uniref:Uncharacterized protein n=1 Tax=Trifolium pratense TaxID=57577 RepID=A0ACB0K6S3_TRIPR|nr:unnamed protein product [Trifolium pratense]